jgi:hypothetical protein
MEQQDYLTSDERNNTDQERTTVEEDDLDEGMKLP